MTSSTEHSDSPLTIGLILADRIELKKYIGHGAQGDVWLAQEKVRPHRECAAKIFTASYARRNAHDVRAVKSDFENEIRNLGTLSARHRFIVNLWFIEEGIFASKDDQQHYFIALVMEYAPIGDLSVFITEVAFRRMREDHKIDLLRRISEGLKAAHDAQVTHSDIKPSNVLIFREGSDFIPKLADFGVAVPAIPLANGGALRGTPPYMAPEVLAGSSSGAASDVFSLGVVFHEVLSGSHPFGRTAGATDLEAVEYYRKAYTAGATYDGSTLPLPYSGLGRLIGRMLDRDPNKRPKLKMVVEILRGYIAELGMSFRIVSSPLFVDQFRWHPRVHENMGLRRHLFSLHSARPDEDVRLLAGKLRDEGIVSFSIHRVLGAHDLVLDCWLEPNKLHRATSAIQVYESIARVNEHIRKVVQEYEPSPDLGEDWKDLTDDRLVRFIADRLPQDDVETQFESLIGNKLVIDSIEDRPNRLRIFLLIATSERMEANERKYYFEGVCRYMQNENDRGTFLGRFRVSTLDDDTSFLLEFTLGTFGQFGKFFFGLALRLDGMVLRKSFLHFSYRTLVEIDAKGVIESDDGELAQRLAEEYQFREMHGG